MHVLRQTSTQSTQTRTCANFACTLQRTFVNDQTRNWSYLDDVSLVGISKNHKSFVQTTVRLEKLWVHKTLTPIQKHAIERHLEVLNKANGKEKTQKTDQTSKPKNIRITNKRSSKNESNRFCFHPSLHIMKSHGRLTICTCENQSGTPVRTQCFKC